MDKISLKSLKIEAQKKIEKAQDLKDLDDIFKAFLGKKGKITQVLRSLKELDQRKRKKIGKQANELKKELSFLITEKGRGFEDLKLQKYEWIDISVPGEKHEIGNLHPLTLVRRKVEEIFQAMGFSVVLGPEMENEWYNFDALNIPKDHPARDMWDTFYLKNGKLLRTHTSPVQIRYMEKHQPPFRIIAPGRIFRHEATDASHETNFYQIEGLMVGHDVSAANFKAIVTEFLSRFFNKPVKTRLRPSFFPFTEPSFEVDISCLVCKGKGCSICSKTGWLELMGAGMVHPNVLKAGGVNPKNWQGFAFGVGMDRLAMMKYKVDDVRLFYKGDLRFLKQF